MKKSDLDIQNENALIMAIAIADGYLPIDKKSYDTEFNKKMRTCGIKDYKEAFNFVYAGMPQYVGDDAIYSGKITLTNKDRDFIDLPLGNNEQQIDEYNNLPERIIEEFVSQNLENQYFNAEDIVKDKYSLYEFFIKHVAPKLLKDRLEIRNKKVSEGNSLQEFADKKSLDTLFDYKFSAFKHREQCRGNQDLKYYSLTHGMLDAVVDFYGSIMSAIDERDIDIRAISPYPNEELGISLPEDFNM